MTLTSNLILYIKELEKRQNADRVTVCGTDDWAKVPQNKLKQYLALLISGVEKLGKHSGCQRKISYLSLWKRLSQENSLS